MRVPGGLMFYCGLFFSGILRRCISELPRPIAVKLSNVIGNVRTLTM